MKQEVFIGLFTKQIDDWKRKIKLSDYFEDIQKVPQRLHYLVISEFSLENVSMEMKSIDSDKLEDFDCSNLELFDSDLFVDSTIPHLKEKYISKTEQ